MSRWGAERATRHRDDDQAATSPAETAYLKFNVSGLSGPLQSATLRVFANSGLRWGFDATRHPTRAGRIQPDLQQRPRARHQAQQLPSGTLTSWIQLDVTPAVTGNGTYSFALVGTYWMETHSPHASQAQTPHNSSSPHRHTRHRTPIPTKQPRSQQPHHHNPAAHWPLTDNVAVTGYDVSSTATNPTTTATNYPSPTSPQHHLHLATTQRRNRNTCRHHQLERRSTCSDAAPGGTPARQAVHSSPAPSTCRPRPPTTRLASGAELDGTSLGAELASPPYTLAWNTCSIDNGTHVLSASPETRRANGDGRERPGTDEHRPGHTDTRPRRTSTASRSGPSEASHGNSFAHGNTVYVGPTTTLPTDQCRKGVTASGKASAPRPAIPPCRPVRRARCREPPELKRKRRLHVLTRLEPLDLTSVSIVLARSDGIPQRNNETSTTRPSPPDAHLGQPHPHRQRRRHRSSRCREDSRVTLDSDDTPYVVYATSGTSNQLTTRRASGRLEPPVPCQRRRPRAPVDGHVTRRLAPPRVARELAATHSTIGYAHFTGVSSSAAETVARGLPASRTATAIKARHRHDTNNTPTVFIDGTVAGQTTTAKRYRTTGGTWSDDAPPERRGRTIRARKFAHTPQNYISSTNANFVFLARRQLRVATSTSSRARLELSPVATPTPQSGSPGPATRSKRLPTAQLRAVRSTARQQREQLDVIYFDGGRLRRRHHHATVTTAIGPARADARETHPWLTELRRRRASQTLSSPSGSHIGRRYRPIVAIP